MSKDLKAKRLEEFRNFKKLSKKEFIITIGYKSVNSYTAIVNANRNVSNAVINQIALKYPELNLNWLWTGKGEMLLTENISVEDDKGIGARLKVTLEEEGIRHEEVAKTLEVKLATISKLLNGDITLSVPVLLKLHEHYDIDVLYILGERLELAQINEVNRQIKALKNRISALEQKA